MRRHGVHTMVGIAWIALVWSLDPHYLPWLLPVVGALILSIPLSVYTSRAGAGRALRRRGVFLIPEETHAVPVLLATRKYLRETGPARGVVDAVVDPLVNAVICAHGVTRGLSEASRFTRRRLVERALHHGIDALTPDERGLLVGDPEALTQLHSAVWTIREAHPSWNAARGDGGARSHQTTVLPEPSDRIEEVPQFPVRAVGA